MKKGRIQQIASSVFLINKPRGAPRVESSHVGLPRPYSPLVRRTMPGRVYTRGLAARGDHKLYSYQLLLRGEYQMSLSLHLLSDPLFISGPSAIYHAFYFQQIFIKCLSKFRVRAHQVSVNNRLDPRAINIIRVVVVNPRSVIISIPRGKSSYSWRGCSNVFSFFSFFSRTSSQ